MGQDASAKSRSFGDWVRWLWHESLVRYFVVEKDGRRPIVVPLLVVIIVGVIAPWLVVIAVVVAVLMSYTLYVERRGDDGKEAVSRKEDPDGAPDTPDAPSSETETLAGGDDTVSTSGGAQPAESSDPPDGT